MGVIQDSELVLYKALASQIKNGLVKPLNSLNSKCFSEFLKFEKHKSKFMNCETFEDLGDSSKKVKIQRDELISLFAVQDRLEKIVKRNEQRLEFINSKLEQMGIYNDAVDKKIVSGILSEESENVSEESLNLNPKSRRDVTFKYFAGEILAFRDDELDFDLDENRDVLVNGTTDFLHEVIETFPYSVATIPKEYYLMSNFKNKILRECILFCASRVKTESLVESNKALGELLENVAEISSFSQFANELKNYFNVIVKQCIKKQAPEISSETDEMLKCNEASIFLPREMKASGGLKQVQKSENLDVTSESKLQEPETLSQNEEPIVSQPSVVNDTSDDSGVSKEELLDLLLNDNDDFSDESETKPKNEVSNEIADEGSSVDEDVDDVLKELEDLFNNIANDDEDDKKEV